MELRIESTDSHSLPKGCYVGVRVGDVLKQGRYEPQRCYHFPKVDRRRNAKIDIYQHIGSCVAAVDPDTNSNQEVAVASSDPSFPMTKINVSVQSLREEAGKQHREDRSKALKLQAKDYLTKHNIEERLSEAVKALLKEQPVNPTEFLCRHLCADQPPVSTDPQRPVPAKPSASEKPAGDVSPSAAVKETKEQVQPKPSHAAAPAGKKDLANEQDAIRAKASNALMQAAGNGSLDKALKEIKQEAIQNQGAATCNAAENGDLEKALHEVKDHHETVNFESPPHMVDNLSVCAPAFSSFGMQPGLLFI